MNNLDKTQFIASSDLALQTLRPCPGYGSGYNCGMCLKCTRVMIDLILAGALDRCQTLPHEIDAERLRAALHPGGTGALHALNYRRRLERLEALGGYPEVCAVLAEHLETANPGRTASYPGKRGAIARLVRLLGG
jgi:hypothetical protein